MAEDTPRQRLRIGLPPDWITPRGEEIGPKVDTYNPDYKPSGGEKKIFSEKVNVEAGSKIDSLANQDHQPGGGDKPIFNERLNFDARAKVGSLENADYKPGGGDKQFVRSERLQWRDEPMLNTRENIDYQSRPSGIRIFNDQRDFSQATAKVGSLNNKEYEPKPSGIRVYHERLPWLEYESNRPRLRHGSGDDEGQAGGGYGTRRDYSRQVERTAQQQERPSQPRRAASEDRTANNGRAALRERQREFAERTKAEAAAKPAATKPRRLPNERDPRPPNQAAEAAAEERRLRQQQLQEQQKRREEKLRQQKQREQQQREQRQKEQQQQREQRQKEEQQQREQKRKEQQQQKKQQQPGNNSQGEQRPSGEHGQSKKEAQREKKAGAGGGQTNGMAKQPRPSGQALPQKQQQQQKAQQKRQKATKAEEKSAAVAAEAQPQREPDDWEYARHEYERPRQAKKDSKKSSAKLAAGASTDESTVPPLELSEEQQTAQQTADAGSRGVKDLYKTEGYAKRFELAPASVTNRSLMLQPLDNYRHDWHEDADVKVRMDGDGRLVLKSNRKVPTRLPRVADADAPPAPATYVSSISKKERPLYDPKPKRVTGEDLGHLLPRLENLLEAPTAPKKHYSQYSVDRKPAEKDRGYTETMKRQRQRHGYSVNPEGERVVLISSDDYNNQFYSEVRVRDAEVQPRPDGPYGRKFEDQLHSHRAGAAATTATGTEEPQADELSDRLMLQPSSSQLPHYRPASDDAGGGGVGRFSVDYDASLGGADSESAVQLPLQQQQQRQRQQQQKKRFVNWKPGEVLYATGERGGGGVGGSGAPGGGGAAYSDRLQRQRQRRREGGGEDNGGGGGGFAGRHEQRKSWYRDYNRRMLAREGNVERVSERELLHTTYELY